MYIYIDRYYLIYIYYCTYSNTQHLTSIPTPTHDQSCFRWNCRELRLTKRRRNVLKRSRTFLVNLLTHVVHMWYTCSRPLWITAELTHSCVTLDGCQFSILCHVRWRFLFDVCSILSVALTFLRAFRPASVSEQTERQWRGQGMCFLFWENVKAQSLKL